MGVRPGQGSDIARTGIPYVSLRTCRINLLAINHSKMDNHSEVILVYRNLSRLVSDINVHNLRGALVRMVVSEVSSIP